MTNSKELFNELVKSVTLNESRDEIYSMIYLLLEDKLGLSKVDIMTGKAVEPVEPDNFQEMIKRVNAHEPIQYILGKADFYGRQFAVNRAVLIPRPETELLIQSLLKENVTAPTILDIGTGSGCIAVTLSMEIASSKVYAVDISETALAIAQQNAHGLQAHVHFIKADILKDAQFDQQFDFIVSNPPYIAESEKKEMNANVLNYEPHLALFVTNDDPLIFYKAIADTGRSILKPKGKIFMEINERFGQEVSDVFKERKYTGIEIIKDVDKKDRVVCAILPRD